MSFIELKIDEITCAHCALGVESVLQSLGLKNVLVDVAAKTAQFDAEKAEVPGIITSLKRSGYTAAPLQDAMPSASSASKLLTRFLLCLPFTVALLVPMFVHISFLHEPVMQMMLSLQ